MKKSQNGFVLISVLLITTVSTVYALSEIRDNRLQERIGGNQQKEINARAYAEQGALAGYAYIRSQNKAEVATDVIQANLAQYIQSLDVEHILVPNPVQRVEMVGVSGATFTFVSQGSYEGATAYFKTEVDAILLSGESLFNDSVVGCDGVTVSAGGVIDSYRSTDGAYDPATANKKSTITTINDNADIDLSGGVNVKGSVDANGSVIAGANAITGDVTAQADISIAGGVSPETGKIGGNIHAGANVTLGYIPITGSVTAKDNFTHGWGANTDPEQMITGDLDYGGVYTKPADYGTVAGNENINGPIGKPTLTTDTCDPMQIASNLPVPVTSGSTITASTAMNVANGGSVVNLSFTPSGAEALDGSIVPATPLKSELLDPDLTAQDVIVFDQLNLAQTVVEISGDVVLYIKGDFTAGSGTVFKFPDTTSSLTIITEGEVSVASDAIVFKDAAVNSQGEPPLTVFSSSSSANAFNFSGDTAMYGKIYAPLGGVNIGASAGLMGAVRGKDINVTGAGGIHYDEVLADIIDIKDPNSGKATVIASSYHYQ